VDIAAEDTPLSQRFAETQNRKGKRLKLYAGNSPASGNRSRNSHFVGPISDSSEESCDGMDSEVKSARPIQSRRQWPRHNEDNEGKTDENLRDENEIGVKKIRSTRNQSQYQRDIEEEKHDEHSCDGIDTEVKKIRSTRKNRRQWNNDDDHLAKHQDNSCDGAELDVKRVRPTRNRRPWHKNIEDQVEKHDDNCDGIDVDVKRIRQSRNRQWQQDTDEQVEKHDEHFLDGADGVRRSTRTKKLMYGSFNTSWLFGNQSIKVPY